ncbi:Dipeptidyl peptidase IV [Fulvivirga imtechensis AK7]|uniref:Dipeptidyl peptidase IV n=1 Tax=Fulvivirga imtechensis AK7 TaxID=1237149 RepID=L8JYJ9_9BACT|nr:S9 family peptidase [Fulvivirga imtechensis]ELR73865.1 Dipeptidyl peptidase IV [Fulvivirga imtechensis AK7]
MLNRKIYLLLFIMSILAFRPELIAQQKEYSDVREALFSGGRLSGGSGPASVNWIDKGDRFSYIDSKNGTPEIRSFNPKTQKDELIFKAEGVKFPDHDKNFEYTSFQWSKDSKYILFQTNFRPVWRRSGISDFYFYSVADKTLKLVAKDAQTAEISPDGTKIGYERDGNLFVFDFSTQKETQLTLDAEEYFYNGRFGWAYEEEFGLAQAWVWSPDSKYIAFWQSDERDVPIFQMTDYSGQHAEYVNVPYPKVGDTNPTVKIGVIDVAARHNQWMDVKLNGGYIPRIYWTSTSGQLAIVHLNRKQNHLKLFFNDVKSGQGKLIMEEQSEAWIDVFDFFAGIMHLFFFPEDKEEFLWISDRDGWSHIYRYDYQGNIINQVTNGEWEVTRVEAVDSKNSTIYYTSTEVSPLERHLYAVNFSGKDKKKLTRAAGRHSLDVAPNGKYYIDSYSNINTPRQVELWTSKGQMLKKFEENKAVKEFTNEHFYSPKELVTFTTSDGQKLDAYIIKPKDFNPEKAYPLVLNIYGGPGAQSVYNEFATSAWEQYLAQQGYVIASVNNRGSGGYGSKFEKVVYGNLGEWESKDFVETAKYLASQSWVDGDRMSIRGHSYGGYMSSYTMLNHPDVFKVSLVGAPVTDWRLYDSIYAERYMDLLNDNKEGYEKSAATAAAGNLQGRMFIAHSAMDENVHMQNTMQLVKALIDNGKDADLRIYPPGAHGVAYNGPSYVLLYTQYVDYLNEHLKAENKPKGVKVDSK